MKRPLISFMAVLASTAFIRCVDTSPLAYVPEKPEGGVRDGSVGDGALVQSCRRCLDQDGAPCRQQYDACVNITKCATVLDCVLDAGCFSIVKLEDRITCGTPCLQKEGVFSANDPTIQALGQVNVCIVASCSDQCFAK